MVEPFRLEYVRKRLPICKLPAELNGKTLVQISDIHIDHLARPGFLIQAFNEIQELRPDFVVYTGDFVSYHDPSFQRFDQIMAHAPSGQLGTVGVLGNHDYGLTYKNTGAADQLIERLGRLGIDILQNEAKTVGGMQFVGVEDLWSPRFDLARAFAQVNHVRPTLALCHNPDGVDRDGWHGYRGWVLSGHTHGGQVKLPFIPPFFLSVKNRRYDHGLKRLADGRTLYINRGLGTSYLIRLNVRPEVTIFHLESA